MTFQNSASLQKRMLAIALKRLSPDEREAWEERAAIMEFDGGLDRDRAESMAVTEFLKPEEPA